MAKKTSSTKNPRSKSARPPRGPAARSPTKKPANPSPRARASLDLGIIGNGTINALLDARGRIVWHCVPAFDGDPVFCSLLSPRCSDAGFFEIVLENETACHQRYLDNSAVLVTTLTAKDGAQVEITDFAPRYKKHGRTFHPMQILRRVRPLSGAPRIALQLRPLTG